MSEMEQPSSGGASAAAALSDTLSAGNWRQGQQWKQRQAGRPGGSGAKVRLAYDLNFEMDFDNREYGASDYAPSGTIFGARLTPSVGVAVHQANGMRHRVMAGIDIMKDFGRSPVPAEMAKSGSDTDETDRKQENWNLFREITIYYQLACRLGKTDFSLTAGVFPKSFSKAEYPRTFFSDSVRFYDNNYEGLLLTFGRPKAYYEVGCDWMGMYGTDRRERFMIFSNGNSRVLPWMKLGYSAYMYHYAGCRNVWGVVDNMLVNPWICFDFSDMVPLQELSVTVGGIVSGQNDRRQVHRYVFPGGAECVFDIRKWNVGLQYRLFVGKDMMPYYGNTDAEGHKYGSSLYFGDPFYRVAREGGIGMYNRVELYYEPHIAYFLDLKVSITGHFHEKYSGCQQQVGLVFNLQRLLERTSR
ncbi:MAG: hypothetical protein NC115_07550 [Bacteroidales bacterium]|nr:hypothetical protein [Bacteroidales bacterium]